VAAEVKRGSVPPRPVPARRGAVEAAGVVGGGERREGLSPQGSRAQQAPVLAARSPGEAHWQEVTVAGRRRTAAPWQGGQVECLPLVAVPE
jgi:hypothetical protein